MKEKTVDGEGIAKRGRDIQAMPKLTTVVVRNCCGGNHRTHSSTSYRRISSQVRSVHVNNYRTTQSCGEEYSVLKRVYDEHAYLAFLPRGS